VFWQLRPKRALPDKRLSPLMEDFGMPTFVKRAELAIMIPQVISGSLTHFFNGNVKVYLAFLATLGAILGAYIGANLVKDLPVVLLKRLFSILLFVVAVRTFLGTI